MGSASDAVVFVVPGDLHLAGTGVENYRTARWAIDQINTRVRPDFVQFIGDNTQNTRAEEFQLFNELRSGLQVPHAALVGDHDVKDDPGATKFRELVGPTWSASSLRGYRFLRLDTVEYRPLGFSSGQVDWFRAEVDEALSRGEHVVVFQHHYPFKVWETFDGPGVAAWREVMQTRRITALFTGHTHYGQTANDGRNVAVATRSIGDPEGGPPGLTIAFLQGDDLAVTYHTVRAAGPIVLITHPRERLLATGPRHVVRGADRLRARVWSLAPPARVRGRLGRNTWLDLEPAGDGFWEKELPGDHLPKGEHVLTVLAEDAEGRRGLHRIRFMVDPTGRYTAVPAVRPAVSGTLFC